MRLFAYLEAEGVSVYVVDLDAALVAVRVAGNQHYLSHHVQEVLVGWDCVSRRMRVGNPDERQVDGHHSPAEARETLPVGSHGWYHDTLDADVTLLALAPEQENPLSWIGAARVGEHAVDQLSQYRHGVDRQGGSRICAPILG